MIDARIARAASALLLSLLAGLAGPTLRAQDDEAGAAERAPAPLTITLTPERTAYTAGDVAVMTLRVRAAEPAQVSAALLSGMDMSCFLDGKKVAAPTLTEGATGETVRFAAGVFVERKLEVPLAPILQGGVDGVPKLTFKWNGLPADAAGGAVATVTMVPDQSGLDVDTLDLRRARVRLITSEGDMVLRFYPDKAPNHVKNFIKLSKDGFYDQTKFHRVIRNFMIQGGCPYTRPGATGRPGTGDPGYTIDAEFNDVRHVRGILSMARSADPNSAGCQFFVCHGEAPHLDGQYTAFGELVDGQDTLDRIANTPIAPTRDRSTPASPIWIYAAVVETADGGE